MSNLRKTVLGGRSTKAHRSGPVDYIPVKWSKYFKSHENVNLKDGAFHYYTKGEIGPLLVTIHGGGYSALTWALFAEEVTTKIECRLLAVDLRGHGNTRTENDNNLSLEQLAKDIEDLIKSIYNDDSPPIVLIGHSLGGAVAVEVAPNIANLVGICVIDVVEGTALDSLSGMQSILRGRPATFRSIEQAVQWGYRGGSTQNLDAARVSMPGQIKNIENGVLASEEVETMSLEALLADSFCKEGVVSPLKAADSIDEEAELELENDSEPSVVTDKPPIPVRVTEASYRSKDDKPKYDWRIDLTKTEKYWAGWFKGLSQKFLSINVPKILLLANIYGLDTSLTVGQMQGKFQLQVLTRSGHAIHEDQPEQVADIIAAFLVRQKLAQGLQGFVPAVPGC